MNLVVDRFEGDRVILDADGVRLELPRALVPADAKEGDVLRLVVDAAGTAARRDAAAGRLERLRARTPQGSGNFDL